MSFTIVKNRYNDRDVIRKKSMYLSSIPTGNNFAGHSWTRKEDLIHYIDDEEEAHELLNLCYHNNWSQTGRTFHFEVVSSFSFVDEMAEV